MNETQCVVLFSGGIDSLAALLWARQTYSNVLAIYCDVGQRYAKKEIISVSKICKSLNQPYIIERRLKLGDMELTKERNAIIPYRNSFFILLASAHLPPEGGVVVLQNLVQGEDSTWDRREKFNIQMQNLLNVADQKNVKIVVPFANFTKSQIVRELIQSKECSSKIIIDTIGCYSKTKKNCGECNSCFRSYIALKHNDLDIIIKSRFAKDPAKWKGVKQYIAKMKAGLYGEERTQETLNVFPELAKKCKVYAIDIDGVLCPQHPFPPFDEDYEKYYSTLCPNKKAIDKVNSLFIDGHAIVLYTSRHEEDRKVTEEWLGKNNVHYHRLILGKFKADAYVDDKLMELWKLW